MRKRFGTAGIVDSSTSAWTCVLWLTPDKPSPDSCSDSLHARAARPLRRPLPGVIG